MRPAVLLKSALEARGWLGSPGAWWDRLPVDGTGKGVSPASPASDCLPLREVMNVCQVPDAPGQGPLGTGDGRQFCPWWECALPSAASSRGCPVTLSCRLTVPPLKPGLLPPHLSQTVPPTRGFRDRDPSHPLNTDTHPFIQSCPVLPVIHSPETSLLNSTSPLPKGSSAPSLLKPTTALSARL